MMNEEEDNPSRPSFLIDLDLAIKEGHNKSSRAPNKTGTKVFMAIDILYGKEYSFMHDLESFFWVLFWICIHFIGLGGEARVTEFKSWNYENTTKLAEIKKEMVVHEGDFIKNITENFSPYYYVLIPWVNRLWKVVFPEGKRRQKKDWILYSQMKEVLRKAQDDPNVLAEWTG